MTEAEDLFVNPVTVDEPHQRHVVKSAPFRGQEPSAFEDLHNQQHRYKRKTSDPVTGSIKFVQGYSTKMKNLRITRGDPSLPQQRNPAFTKPSWRKLRYFCLASVAFALGGTLLLNARVFVGGKNKKVVELEDETKRRMLGKGTIPKKKRKGIIPWNLANSGRDPSRDRLVQWWVDNPTAPVGLSCAVFDKNSGEGDVFGEDSPEMKGLTFDVDVYGKDAPEMEGLTFDESSRHFASSAESHAKVQRAVTSVSIDPDSGTDTHESYVYHGYDIPPPIFKGRTPATGKKRVQVAFVLPFVEFQVDKVAALLLEHWSKHPPCLPDSPRQSADLVFFTENKLRAETQRRVMSYYADLGSDKTGCFRTDEPIFLSLSELDPPKLSHLEGAAFTFYSLFRLLETDYRTFMLAEPDMAPVRCNFLPALVKKSRTVNCDDEGLWQIGSIPLAKDIEAGMLRERLDYHMNGNAIYVLGCPDFEEYKCRVQTFYVPKDDCALVAGCQTHEAYEGGYDHALYRFRMHPDNYEYSRLVLNKFAYSNFAQNRGEGMYMPEDIVRDSPSTYFVHSKSIYMSSAATTLKEVTVSVMRRDVCNGDAAVEKEFQRIYRYLRNGEYSKVDAIRHLCEASKNEQIFGPMPKMRACEVFQARDNRTDLEVWKSRMPGKAYLWTMDFHGGPTNCDLPIITQAGGAVHAEIDGICDFYGLCKDRLKVIKADNWKEFDPTEQQKLDFKRAYENDPEFKRVDAFICHHPVANCELFLPFNKSIIIHATTRLEFGRHDEGIDWRLSSGYDRDVGKEKWKRWIRTMQKLAANKRNVIAANNAYDRDYIKYFTGISDVELIPSWCGDGIGVKFCEAGWESSLSHTWLPTRPEVIIVPYRSNLDRTRYKGGLRDPVDHPIIKELMAVPQKLSNGTEVKMIRELYSDANPLRMLKHPAIVILPYQVSTMQLVELYRLNIPTFCPSLSLLKRWCREHDLMWEVHYGWPENLMGVQDTPNPNGHPMMDKYSKEWESMFDYWIPKSDFYELDHIHYFDSWEHFYRQYQVIKKTGELEEINHKMVETNAALRESLVEQWRGVLDRVRQVDSG